MKEIIKVEKEIETDGKYCEQSCDGCVEVLHSLAMFKVMDYPIAECAIFSYNLELKDGKVLRCVKCLKASGIN